MRWKRSHRRMGGPFGEQNGGCAMGNGGGEEEEEGREHQRQPRRDEREDREDVIVQALGNEEESVPVIFSPRPSSDGLPGPRTKKFLVRVRSVFCCLSPTSTSSSSKKKNEGETNGGVESFPPKVVPSAESEDGCFVIGPKRSEDGSKKTLVLDLDETLVHSSFNRVPDPDFIIPVDIDGKLVDVYVQKRPFLDQFLKYACSKFEVVIFTASLSKYADPLLDLLDRDDLVRWRLFREACSTHRGTYVKDLCRLGRKLSQTVIVDNSPLSYVFQPGNALPISAFVGASDDHALLDMLPMLDRLAETSDVRDCIKDSLGESASASIQFA